MQPSHHLPTSIFNYIKFQNQRSAASGAGYHSITFFMFKQPPSHAQISSRPVRALIICVSTLAALWSLQAQAQATQAPIPALAASSAKAEPAAPRYSAKDLERAFNFMDSNGDGKLNRNEAARFPGVKKYFDRADTDGDGFLSRDEFDKAMNYVKSE